MMKYHRLGLFEAYHVIRWPAGTFPLFCFRSKRVNRGLFFVREEYLVAEDLTSHVGTIPTFGLPLTSLCDLPLLFVYFQVNNGVLYFLEYEDI